MCVGNDFCLSPAFGPPGTEVSLTAPADGRRKDGSRARLDRIDLRWNLEPSKWTTVVFEPDRDEADPSLVARDGKPSDGRFELTFRVPRVEPGPHPVVALVYGGNGASHIPFRFIVTSEEASRRPASRSAGPDCGTVNTASDEYGTEINPSAGPPGTIVRLYGDTLRNEDGKWAPSHRLEGWWDTDVPGYGIKLAKVGNMNTCHFETMFTVPDVKPGFYRISVFSWNVDPRDGYGLYLPHRFTVTSR